MLFRTFALLSPLFVVAMFPTAVGTTSEATMNEINQLKNYPITIPRMQIIGIEPLFIIDKIVSNVQVNTKHAKVTFSDTRLDLLTQFDIEEDKSIDGKLILKWKQLVISNDCTISGWFLQGYGKLRTAAREVVVTADLKQSHENGPLLLSNLKIEMDHSSIFTPNNGRNIWHKFLVMLFGSKHILGKDFEKLLVNALKPGLEQQLEKTLNHNLKSISKITEDNQ